MWAPYTPVTVTVSAYTADPDITLEFEPQEIVVVNRSTDILNTIFVSFDGRTDHIELIMGTPLESYRAGTRQKKVWFRRGTYNALVAAVALMANSYV